MLRIARCDVTCASNAAHLRIVAFTSIANFGVLTSRSQPTYSNDGSAKEGGVVGSPIEDGRYLSASGGIDADMLSTQDFSS